MSKTIEIKKLKRIMNSVLRWRLQLPRYYPQLTPIPKDAQLNELSRGVKCAYRDLIKEIEKIEKSENQRRIWNTKSHDPYDFELTYDMVKYDGEEDA